ncbi:unnamed protein product [Laminaria digitata]
MASSDCTRLRELGEAVGYYHEFKVVSIAKGLGAEGPERYQHAMRQVRAGVGFGTAEHSVKALQLALSDNCLGGKPDAHGKIPGYRISFDFSRPPRPAGSVHPYSGSVLGMYLGFNKPPEDEDDDAEENHRGDCRAKFGGLDLCPQLSGVDLNPASSSPSPSRGDERATSRGGRRVGKHPTPSGEGVTRDTYAFEVSLRSELGNASLNRRTGG